MSRGIKQTVNRQSGASRIHLSKHGLFPPLLGKQVYTNNMLLYRNHDLGIHILSEVVSMSKRLQVADVGLNAIISKAIGSMVHVLIVFSNNTFTNMFVSGMSFDPSGCKAREAFSLGVGKENFPQIPIGNKTPRFVKHLGEGKAIKQFVSNSDEVETIRGNMHWSRGIKSHKGTSNLSTSGRAERPRERPPHMEIIPFGSTMDKGNLIFVEVLTRIKNGPIFLHNPKAS
jgi:hypothetical protein